jgi:1,4-alpha-glucan branching enzyme
MPRKIPNTSRTKDKKVKFELFAPEAQSVALAGDFNNWDVNILPMKRDSKGIWKVSPSLASGRYEYLFWVDGVWHDDPKAQERTENPFGNQNCVRIVS